MNIYYFSGTGNSLAVAKEVNRNFEEKGTLISIAKLQNERKVHVNTNVIGFVFPVYMMDVPKVVSSFIEKLIFDTDPYIFAIATCNGTAGITLFELNKCLKKKGHKLSSAFSIKMPGNALITPKEEIVERLNNYKYELVKISEYIRNNTSNNDTYHYSLMQHIGSFIMKPLGKKMYLDPKKVSCTSDCVGCGICEKVCLLNNIKLVNSKPQWGENCSTCLACFHWCPKRAIVGGSMLNKREQYHNPEISLADMK